MSANYQSLYRRFRPQRFCEVLGQDHVTRALRAAVASDTVGHAYLFSGPRGTGKTSTARILAKALNCENLVDGEPCLTCDSCIAIASGASGEVEELDAASNSGVDAMRWLIQTVATAGTGRWKVYIIDEVHMLSTAASNALLKTLEEPPPHVIFILATTNPQKVLQTVVSRTQHFEFHLLDASTAGEVVDDIASRTGVELSASTRQWVLRRGRGSARDTLSVLEQVLALGQVIPEVDASIERAVENLLELEAGAAVLAIEDLLQAGNDPLWVVSEMLMRLKDQFLASLGGQGGHYPLARVTRIMETLGRLSVGVRDALDPGVVLEAVLVQLIAEISEGASLEERVRRLEESLHRGSPARAGGPEQESAPKPPRPSRDESSGARSASADLARLRGAIGRPGIGAGGTASPDRSQPAVPSPTQPQADPRRLSPNPEPPSSPALGSHDELSTAGEAPASQMPTTDASDEPASPASPAHRSPVQGEVAAGRSQDQIAPQGDRGPGSAKKSAESSARTPGGEELDRAATERLRSVIQAEWLDRFLLALNQRNIRAWIRDTRLVVVDAGEIGIVLDHETRRKKLEPYLNEIAKTLRTLYGDGLRVRLMLESETSDDSSPAIVEPDEMAMVAEDESTQAEPTERFSDDAVVANVIDVFPSARLIQGEL